MRVLSLAPYPIYPVKAGNQVLTVNLCNYLETKGHELGYIYLDYGNPVQIDNSSKIKWLEYYSINGAVGKKYTGLVKKIVNKLCLAVGISPIRIPFLFSKSDFKSIERSIRTNKYDIVIVHFPVFSFLQSFLKQLHVKTVIVTHDLHYLRQQRLVEFGKVNSLINLENEKLYELTQYKGFDLVNVVSSHEYGLLLKEGFRPEQLSLSGISIDTIEVSTVKENEINIKWDLLFLGTAGHAPNVDGINWFLDKVWPEVNLKYPDLTFAIAGSICDLLKDKVTKLNNVKLLGFVDNLSALYCESSIVIVPLRFGSGVKVKFIEALAHGKAVISTDIGAEGLSVCAEDHYLNANTVSEWLSAISKFESDDSFTKKTEQQALCWAQENVSHNSVWEQFEQQISNLALYGQTYCSSDEQKSVS
jgi:glycosyltransferase involved in cell wall biosynthesis